MFSPPGLCRPAWLLSDCSSWVWHFLEWPPSGWSPSFDFPPCPHPLSWLLHTKIHIHASPTKTLTALVWVKKRVMVCFTLQIGFDSSRIFKIAASQWSSFSIGAEHLHTLQVSCLGGMDHKLHVSCCACVCVFRKGGNYWKQRSRRGTPWTSLLSPGLPRSGWHESGWLLSGWPS